MNERATSSKMIELEQPPVIEKAALLQLVLPQDNIDEADESIAEMKRLAWTAGADVVEVIRQRRAKICPATFVGKGKVEALREACLAHEAGLVIVDGDLSAGQEVNLSEALGVKVIDRTQLILDIFAQRAQTNEGRCQVELAQLQYLLPRLVGKASKMMRQQGGIGVRGPGEQKLEVDRRVVRERIARLQVELESIRERRKQQRKRRIESGTPTVALVGYTNAGKSSLLNALCNADAFVEDKLFATLDPTSRRRKLPSGREVVFTDTVGFIRKLPHTLVAAFRATLEEVNEASLVLIVADASYPAVEDHLRAVQGVLDEIKFSGAPAVKVFNKRDITGPAELRALRAQHHDSLFVSARTGEGLDELLETVDIKLSAARRRLRFRIPQSEAWAAARVHALGHVTAERYEDNAIVLDAEMDGALEHRLEPFLV